MNRRDFLRTTGAAIAVAVAPPAIPAATKVALHSSGMVMLMDAIDRTIAERMELMREMIAYGTIKADG